MDYNLNEILYVSCQEQNDWNNWIVLFYNYFVKFFIKMLTAGQQRRDWDFTNNYTVFKIGWA